ncbi:GAP1-N1 domain-containing protein [Pseudoalteromonas sp.]|uniref:GAP1-N1 domain-containing protein n=1 Tax=Pseudoalteromonas sp. TaxID=53249 RepID=UPI00300262F3
MTIIQQAIYGEVQGKTSGHELLAASDEKNELFRRVSGHTDLADRPEGGVLSSSVMRGLFAEDHFLLIKTFPDKSPGLRSGRVFSHALFIPKADLHRVHNLSNLFQYLLPDIQKEAKMHSIDYRSQGAITIIGAVDGREAAATNALIEKQPFVWLGEEGYWDWLARIWPRLPAKEKCTLKIGAAFGPSYVKKENLNLLYIPIGAKTLWVRHSFRVVDTEESQNLESLTANWLVGVAKKSASLEVLIDDFGPIIDSIETLKQLEDYGKAYHQINNTSELNHLLVLANFVSRISPSEKVGIKGKSRLMNAILQAIPNAPINILIALIYQTWKGFPKAVTSLSDSLRDWLTNHLINGKQAKECGAVLVRAVETETKNWWSSTVLSYLNNRLKNWQSRDASILWQWMEKEPMLITRHHSWLPDDVENELTEKIPLLEKTVAESVLHMSEQKNWLVLHAQVAVQLYSAEKAIEAQLRIDTDENHIQALQTLSRSINSSSFVSAAASHTDARLYSIAGKLIAENSNLMKGVDITSKGWQNCWKTAIEHGSEVWQGIPKPQQVLFEILDHMLAGNSFNSTLLSAISIGKYNNLKDYPQRVSIWSVLPEHARTEFVSATFVELMVDNANGKFNYNVLESELKKELQSQKVQQYIFSSKAIPLTKKLQLFGVFSSLGEYHARQLIQDNQFSPAEAKEFGRIVATTGHWKTVVDELYNKRSHRNDLLPALLQCSHLLGFWQRMALASSGLKPDAISAEEWMDEFFEIAIKLFPSGPDQNGLWVSAGGDQSQLITAGTGRDKWSHAVQIMRNNGNPTRKKLLSKMRDIYSSNEILKKLQGTL